ncbi:hypothetical protein REPUB_Repub01dG0001100 [Reevesia pubescens]
MDGKEREVSRDHASNRFAVFKFIDPVSYADLDAINVDFTEVHSNGDLINLGEASLRRNVTKGKRWKTLSNQKELAQQDSKFSDNID